MLVAWITQVEPDQYALCRTLCIRLVARKVMEETPIMLAGEGAKQFAIEQGLKPLTLLRNP